MNSSGFIPKFSNCNQFNAMSSLILVTILSVLCTLVSCQQRPDNSSHLIDQLNDFFRFDHQILLTDSLSDLNRLLPTRSPSSGSILEGVTPQTVYIFNDLQDGDLNVTHQLATCSVNGKKRFLIAVVSRSLKLDSKIFAQIKSIRDCDVNLKIGVFFAYDVNSLGTVEQLFRWSWSVGIVNIFCAFNYPHDNHVSVNIFKYNPFGKFDLVNITSSESFKEYFPDKLPNYRKHPIEFVVIEGLEITIGEIELWNTVVDVFNASQTKVFINHSDYGAFEWEMGDILHHENELSADEGIVLMYPFRQVTMGIIVPHAELYTDFMAYLRNGTWTLLIVYTFIVILTSSLLLTVSGYLQNKEIQFLQSILDVVNLLLNDNETIKYRKLHLADGCITVPLTFTGLIVMNGIVSIFQSYITSPIYKPQIKSIAQLYASPVPILVNDLEWKDKIIEILEDVSQHSGWRDKVHGTQLDQLVDTIYSFNKSHAFFVFDYDAKMFLETQRRLDSKAYYLLSETFFGRYLVSFQIRPNFPFTESISDIVHRLNGAGLIDKWTEKRYEDKVKGLWERNFNLQFKSGNESSDSEFAVPTVVWCGWLASGIVFVFEVLWNKIKTVPLHCKRENKPRKLWM